MPTCCTNLEDIETNQKNLDFSSYREYLDRLNPASVEIAQKFYEEIDFHANKSFSLLLSNCRSRAWFIRHTETGHVRLATKQCRLRWCYYCGESRQQYITHAVSPWYTAAKDPKLLTVTLKHTQTPLPDQIDKLYKAFVKLRSRTRIKKATRGGVWFFQVTYNKQRQEWHPHIHALIDALYIPKEYIAREWYKITKNSTNIHIKAVYETDKTLSHNARYAARPSALHKIPEDLWPELYEAFDGRRIVGTWGTAREISLRPKKPDDSAKWKSIGSFRSVIGLKQSNDDAKMIWRAWTMNEPLEEEISLESIEDFIDDKNIDILPPREWDYQNFMDFK